MSLTLLMSYSFNSCGFWPLMNVQHGGNHPVRFGNSCVRHDFCRQQWYMKRHPFCLTRPLARISGVILLVLIAPRRSQPDCPAYV